MIYLENTVGRIKKSAQKKFLEKGFNGAHMQEIAKEAEVSQSLLHYYFRTKEHLFKIIIEDSINLIVNNISPILIKELSFFELIDQFIYNNLVLFKDNKNLLSFIINEYNQNFEKVNSEFKPIILFFKEFEHKVYIQSQKENIKLQDTRNLIINIISLCGWQVIGFNIFNLDDGYIKNLDSQDIAETRKYIYESVVSSLKIK